MKTHLLLALTAAVLAQAASPVIVDLHPRGAERGRPFKLTVSGRNLDEGARIVSTLPGTFTPLGAASKEALSFLVEPRSGVATGVYPVRLQTAEGISNILLFTIGSFPETQEEESATGAKANSNDNIEAAQPLQQGPLVVNGKLNGPERDVFRVAAKAGEKRVIEVEARRAGSAIDPVIRVFDGAGNPLARSEDALGIGLDARVDVTFPADGNYYVEVHDARFSTQEQNFYRLKMGSYPYVEDLFPLGGKRGETVDVELTGARLAKPVHVSANLSAVREVENLTWVQAPQQESTLPLAFAVGDYKEVREPVSAPLALPVTINGRLAKPGESDTFPIAVQPGDAIFVEVQARELGTSKLMALIAAKSDKLLAQAGDEPLVASLTTVGQSQTARDPWMRFTVPAGVTQVNLSIEDLAKRGGPGYGYRIVVRKQTEDFTASIINPFVNIPRGGAAQVTVSVDRRGVDGPVQFRVANLPKGITAAGGIIPAEGDRSSGGSKVFSRRGVIVLTSAPDAPAFNGELEILAEAKTSSGETLQRRARGPGMQVGVTGATAQGVVDRQRPISAPWLAMQLPAALTGEPAAVLTVKQVDYRREAEGDRFQFTWKWEPKAGATVMRPDTLNIDIAGINDIRIIDVLRDPKDPNAGSFVVTTTKVTMPSAYDLIASGPVSRAGLTEEVYAQPLRMEVTEFKTNETTTASNGNRD